jgi:hypothetical protein
MWVFFSIHTLRPPQKPKKHDKTRNTIWIILMWKFWSSGTSPIYLPLKLYARENQYVRMLVLFFWVSKQMDETHCKKKEKKYTKVQGTHSPLFKKDAHFLTCNSASPKTKHFFAPFFCSVVNKNLEPSIIKCPHQSSHTLFGGYKPFWLLIKKEKINFLAKKIAKKLHWI